MIKQALGIIFVRGEAKLPNLDTNNITVTEVRMSPDLKTAKAFVLPLGGKNATEVIDILKEFSYMVRKVLSKKNYNEIFTKITICKRWIIWLCRKNWKFNKTN